MSTTCPVHLKFPAFLSTATIGLSHTESTIVFEISAGRGRFHGRSVEYISSEVLQFPCATPWHSKAEML